MEKTNDHIKILQSYRNCLDFAKSCNLRVIIFNETINVVDSTEQKKLYDNDSIYNIEAYLAGRYHEREGFGNGTQK